MMASSDNELKNFEKSMRLTIQDMQGLQTSRKFAKSRRADLYDMNILGREFSKLCPDFLVEPVDKNDLQTSVIFAWKVLFSADKYFFHQARHRLHETKTMMLVYKDADGNMVSNCAILHHKNSPSTVSRPRAINGTIHLTIQQACLLALKKMDKVFEFRAAKGEYLLTDRTKSVFYGSITGLYAELKAQLGIQYDIAHLVKILNHSTAIGGENLPHSELHVAVAYTLATTAHFKDRAEAKRLIEHKLRVYLGAGKSIDIPMFELFAKYFIRERLLIFSPPSFEETVTTEAVAKIKKELDPKGNSVERLQTAESEDSDDEYVTAESSGEETEEEIVFEAADELQDGA